MEARRTLCSPPELTLRERRELLRQGRSDAKRRLTYVTEEGELVSPFNEVLIQEANSRIMAVWLKCNGIMFDLRRFLEQERSRRKASQERLRSFTENGRPRSMPFVAPRSMGTRG